MPAPSHRRHIRLFSSAANSSAIAFRICYIYGLYIEYKAGLSLLCLWPTIFPFQALQGHEHGFPLDSMRGSSFYIYLCIAEGHQDKTAYLHYRKRFYLYCFHSVLYGGGIPLRILLQSLAWVLCYIKYSDLSINMGSVPKFTLN